MGSHEDDKGSSGFNADVEKLGQGLKAGIEKLSKK
jgi:hypothetical protein